MKSIPIKGAGHNAYVTPDGRYVVAGSVAGKSMTVIDAQTEEPLWDIVFDLGVRPMAFEQTRTARRSASFVQLTDFNGFAVVDFATHKETAAHRAAEARAPDKKPVLEGGNTSHGMAVIGRQLAAGREQPAQQCRSISTRCPTLKLVGLGRRRGTRPTGSR